MIVAGDVFQRAQLLINEVGVHVEEVYSEGGWLWLRWLAASVRLPISPGGFITVCRHVGPKARTQTAVKSVAEAATLVREVMGR